MTVPTSWSPRGVGISALGAVSAAGASASATLERVFSPRPLLAPLSRYELDIPLLVGEAPDEAFADHDCREHDSPTGRLCLAAARECVRGADGPPDGLVLGTSTGGQVRNEEYVRALLDGRPVGEIDLFGQGLVSTPARLLTRELAVSGPVQTVCTACTSASHALVLGALWVASGRARRVLAGGGDALCLTSLGSFHALQLTGAEPASPFGEDRPGMSIGEGAAFFLLEPLDAIRGRGDCALAALLGSGMSADANHMTAPDPEGEGALRAMSEALDRAGLRPENVDHVNAHGTGTALNDAAEATALARLFESRAVPVSSNKGILGHTLGGAGALNALTSIEAVRRRRAPGNFPAGRPGADCPVHLAPAGGVELPESPVVLSNAFAFGGNNVTLIFGSGS